MRLIDFGLAAALVAAAVGMLASGGDPKNAAANGGAPPERPRPEYTKPKAEMDAFARALAEEISLDGETPFPEDTRFEHRYLIATIPNPGDTHLADQFDSALTSIQKAMTNSGYVLARYWLPWDQRIKSEEAKSAPLDEREPGLIVFRKEEVDVDRESKLTASRPRLLVLLIVGESPTQGIHKAAFARALELMGQDETWRKEDGVVRIVGPTYSGAARSLRLAMELASPGAGGLTRFRLISGTATNERIKSILTERTPGPINFEISFETTVVSDPDTALAADDYFDAIRLGGRATKALLLESSTAYAEGLSTHHAGGYSTLEFHYPLHISQLRVAYEREQMEQAKSAPPSADISPGALVQLRLDDAGEPTTVPGARSELTKHEDELVLQEALSDVHRHNTRLLGLLGTDTRDKLFLAKLIRRYSPDAQIFTFESDRIYTHPDFSEELRGTIVASSYPLSALESAAASGSSVEQFASSGAEGVFNATLIQLADLGDGHASSNVKDYYYANWQTPVKTPRVWLSVVGAHGFWPLASYRVPAPSRASVHPVAEAPDANRGEERLTGSRLARSNTALLAGILLCIFAVAQFLVLERLFRGANEGKNKRKHRSLTRPPELFAEGLARFYRWLQPVRDDPVGRTYLEVSTLVGLATALISTYYWRASIGVLPPLGTVEGWTLAGHFLPWLGANFFFFLSALWIVRPLQKRAGGVLSKPRSVISVYLLGSIFLLMACVFIVVEVVRARHGAHEELYFDELKQRIFYAGTRAVHLFSGVSPLLPMLLIAVGLALWCLSGVLRARIRRTLVRDEVFGILQWIGLDASNEIERLESFILERRGGGSIAYYLLLTTLVFGPLVLIQELCGTFEGAAYDWLLTVSLVLLYIATARSFARAAVTIMRLKHLLVELADHPLAGAYDRLTTRFGRRMGLEFIAIGPAASALTEPRAYLRLLLNHLRLRARIEDEKLASLPTGPVVIDPDAVSRAEARWPNAVSRLEGSLERWLQGPLSIATPELGPATLKDRYTQEKLKVSPDLPGAWSAENLPPGLTIDHATGEITGQPTSAGDFVVPVSFNPVAKTEGTVRKTFLLHVRAEREKDPAHAAVPHPAKLPVALEELHLEEEEHRTTRERRLRDGVLRETGAVLRQFWDRIPNEEMVRNLRARPSTSAADASASTFYADIVPYDLNVWVRLAEEMAAIRVVQLINHIIAQFRHSLGFALTGGILLLLVISAYPVRPHGLLQLLLWLVMLGQIAGGVLMFVDLERDEVLSRVIRTEPGQVNLHRGFISTIVVYALVPLMGLLAIQFPEIGGVISKVVEPLLKSLH